MVTAQKRQRSLNDVPLPVTALSGQQLENMGIRNVQDLVKATPGLSMVEGGRSVRVYSLRGIGFFDTSLGARPTVSVYLFAIRPGDAGVAARIQGGRDE